MEIQFNTDNHIVGSERQNAYFNTVISEALSRFSSHITRLEVHMTDENGHKESKNDQRCVIEARLEGLKPIAVTNHADTMEYAVKGAIDKLKASLDTTLGRLKKY
ncbi:MAG TPA: HPF/RaiA family ribosome-associated protein [Sphingobacteriaceae bacterium]|nr:HPF/RaiA family ribosome-associated protein [Sphingobacteriaceae bacterium]